MIGKTLGHYEITAHLGTGGMGAVYQATDGKLGRSVAIKVLPELFAKDPERAARLSREARTLALVSHPNIATIFGIEETSGGKFLIMELAPGETLEERIARGPIPCKEALAIARQIADALESAHEKGVIHRDLKPANIKVTQDGHVKVLDFGLAKALADDPGQIDISNSPTLTIGATREGMIMGTAAYMSPEQAQGKDTDRRTDIFSFGSVLFEMLTGRPAFTGESVAQILARVIEKEPDWTVLPPSTPSTIRRLLQRCMAKDRNKRLKSADTIRLDLEDAMEYPGIPEAAAIVPIRKGMPWVVAGFLITAVFVLAIPTVRHLSEAAPTLQPEMRTDIATPQTTDTTSFALSPNGKDIVFVASTGGQQRLWLRHLDQTSSQELAGTEGASFPFWSADSQTIGFFDGSKLKRVDITGGPVRVITEAANRGGTWNSNDIILFAKSVGDGIYSVAASGGTPTRVTRLEKQTSHRFPYFLPDGKHFLFYAIGTPNFGGLFLGEIGRESGTRLTASDSAGIYLDGWVLFVRSNVLLAQQLDIQQGKLIGQVVTVTSSASFEAATFSAAITASTTGLLAYRSGGATRRQLTWFDRNGKPEGTWGSPDDSFMNPDISHDGKRVVVWRTVQGNGDVWMLDATRLTRLTFDASLDRYPIWNNDGTRVYFDSSREGPRAIYQVSPDSPGSETPLYRSELDKVANDISSDGNTMIFGTIGQDTSWDLWTVSLKGELQPKAILKTPYEERRGVFSPDGNWYTYTSNESGQYEVYVRSATDGPGQWQISNGGGGFGRWSANGNELYYIGPGARMMVASVAVKGLSINPGESKELFKTRIVGGGTDMNQGIQYDVSKDGKFLINTLLDDVGTAPITLLQNWHPSLH